MNKSRLSLVKWWFILSLPLGSPIGAMAGASLPVTRFEIDFPRSIHSGPITGRLFLMISRTDEPRLQTGWVDGAPLFGRNISELQPDHAATIDENTTGFPISLRGIRPGDYYVQALVNVYTCFPRADGHVIWAHMDHWEGQNFLRSPGNLFSKVLKVHLDASHGYDIRLSLTKMVPPIHVPSDSIWVKHIKIQSSILTGFWGHPMYLGAVVLLPKGYVDHPSRDYPVIYCQGHFSLDAPFGFNPARLPESEQVRRWRKARGFESGNDFYRSWMATDFPRVIAVTFQHPTPFYDDSYAVNSANNGPYGDAIMKELIPYLEEHFRIIRKSYARVLTGKSTGGWAALALQLYNPEFFGGAWVFCPDPVDFRHYGLVNIYDDRNAFELTGSSFIPTYGVWSPPPERSFARAPDGQPLISVRELSRFENVLGTRGRSGEVFENWEAVFGPTGADGYPEPLWDKKTGVINHRVAFYMRNHGYDLRYYLATHWSELEKKLAGKLHFYVGDMDSFYLNLAVYDMEAFLSSTQEPQMVGTFTYGRPEKIHGWQPMTNAELVKIMAEAIRKNRPAK